MDRGKDAPQVLEEKEDSCMQVDVVIFIKSNFKYKNIDPNII